MSDPTEYNYYPGCSLEATGIMYDTSSRAVAGPLGIKLAELDDWNCCGATSYMNIRELRSFGISSRNLALAEKTGKKDLVTVCTACYTTLYKTADYLEKDEKLKQAVNKALTTVGLECKGKIKVRHLLDVIVNDIGIAAVRKKLKRSLKGIKVAAYYGCQLSRPYGQFDDKEVPTTMDQLFRALGADVVDFPMRAKCCAGMHMTTSQDVAINLVGDLLQCASDSGAECIITCCPLCHINLDSYQAKVNKFRKKLNKPKIRMPILYFTQLLGLALGIPPKELGIGKEIVPAKSIVEKIDPGTDHEVTCPPNTRGLSP